MAKTPCLALIQPPRYLGPGALPQDLDLPFEFAFEILIPQPDASGDVDDEIDFEVAFHGGRAGGRSTSGGDKAHAGQQDDLPVPFGAEEGQTKLPIIDCKAAFGPEARPGAGQ